MCILQISLLLSFPPRAGLPCSQSFIALLGALCCLSDLAQCASSKLDATGAVLLPTLDEECLPEDAEDWPPSAVPAAGARGSDSGVGVRVSNVEIPRGNGEAFDPDPSEGYHQPQMMHDAADDDGGWDGVAWKMTGPRLLGHSPPGARPRPWGMSGEGEGGKEWGSLGTRVGGVEFPEDPEVSEVYDPYKPLDMEDVTGGLAESAESVWNRPEAIGKQRTQMWYSQSILANLKRQLAISCSS